MKFIISKILFLNFELNFKPKYVKEKSIYLIVSHRNSHKNYYEMKII